MHARACLAWVCVTLAALLLGCGDDAMTTEAGRAVMSDAGSAGANAGTAPGDGENGEGAGLDNDQIVGVMLAANAGEQVQGRLAMDDASDPRVRAFGTRMYNEHGQANGTLAAMVETTSLEWGVSPLSDRVSDAAERDTQRLAQLRGDAFDSEYVATQFAAHTQLLALVEDELLPAVTNPLLDSELVSMRKAAATHIVEARALRDARTDAGVDEP